ncbi:MAG TPA: MotA/TolQ/ExbB proton channel family protein [Kiritimatiellia bacterium]|nr:MotA/TolQ/ExbB proton channel family protein [Kiritimatiellia bacterium]HMO98381.1 MotA/TolQ/ExbB proton channel family protein [Kiritimatiellia bacterium]HMP96761.1 MotA/TolQ/ExbB proton channel family protein [Kiritimatiellia bacterium]
MRTMIWVALVWALVGEVRVEANTNTVSMEAAIRTLQKDIERASAELIRARETIAQARRPLAETLDSLQREVADLRNEAARQRILRQQDERERIARAETKARREDEFRYLSALLSEYERSAATRMLEIEARHPTEQHMPGAEAQQPEELPKRLAVVLNGGVDRAARRLGGYRFPATAVDAQGQDVAGTALLAGPVAYFFSSDGSQAGVLGTRFGRAHPSLEKLPAGAGAAIRELAEGRSARVPVDVSGGDAIKVEQAKTSWGDDLRKGGFVMWPLGAVGLLALVLAVWKAWSLARTRVEDHEAWSDALRLVRTGDVDGARAMAERAPQPLRSVFQEGIAYRAVPRERLEEILHEHIVGFMPALERHLGTLAVLGGIAPLLGLLGTVTGMIHTFQLVTIFGSGDAKLLSGGISEALITTKYGLVIAVPVLLAHAGLVRRARGLLAAFEQTAIAVVNDLKGRDGA